MSYNNYVDADAAWALVCDFEETACAIIKHTNPAGVGLSPQAEAAYRKALATDPVSASGGDCPRSNRSSSLPASACYGSLVSIWRHCRFQLSRRCSSRSGRD
jgi:AICAR transformylase/IMP cyclohydrolase PurH